MVGGILFTLAEDDIDPARSSEQENPWLYTLDLLLPVVSLKYRDLFVAQHAGLWFSVVFTIAGWILGSILAVGVVRMIKRPA